jgi:hypothetical protein
LVQIFSSVPYSQKYPLCRIWGSHPPCLSLNVRDEVSCSHKTTGKFIVSCSLPSTLTAYEKTRFWTEC